jgi:hypothetical protein
MASALGLGDREESALPQALQQEIDRLVSQAAADGGHLDIGEALKRLAALDEGASSQRRALVNALVTESLRAGVNPQLPIV